MPSLQVLLLLGPVVRFLSPVLSLALRVRQPELGRFMRIDQLATEAYGRSQWPEAEALASEGLGLAERYASNWNYGNVIHNSHQILGLLHLRAGVMGVVLVGGEVRPGAAVRVELPAGPFRALERV